MTQSLPEKKIHSCLEELGLFKNKDYWYNVPLSFIGETSPFGLKLRVDFLVRINPLKFAIIEWDGEHHFSPGSIFHNFSDEKYKKSIDRDSYKDLFCIRRGISLLRIPFTFYLCQTDISKQMSLKFVIQKFLHRVSLLDITQSFEFYTGIIWYVNKEIYEKQRGISFDTIEKGGLFNIGIISFIYLIL